MTVKLNPLYPYYVIVNGIELCHGLQTSCPNKGDCKNCDILKEYNKPCATFRKLDGGIQ